MMRALVIGGNGFIGSHLVDALAAAKWDVTVLDIGERRYDPLPPQVKFVRGSLAQAEIVRGALSNVDIVYHLAWSTIHEVSNKDPLADVRANLLGSIQLMDLCVEAAVKRLVFVSSGGAVYGLAEQVPIDETHSTNPLSAYGVTKLAVEKYLQLYGRTHGLDYAIIRPSVPYGPRQYPLGRQGAVAVFLYRVALDLPVTIWGDGSVTRDYFYIADLVRALVEVAGTVLDEQRIFNIGGAQGYTLAELLAAVEQIVGRKVLVEHLPARTFDPPDIILDTSLAQRLLDWKAEVALTEGLARTWSWLAEAHDLAR